MCDAISRNPTVRSVDAPAEVTHEDGHTGFIHFRCRACLHFSRETIPLFLSFVDREVELGALMV